MNFSLHIGFLPLLLTAFFAASVATSALIYFFRVRKVTVARNRADHERPEIPDSAYPPVSVLVYSQDDAENLSALLPGLLGQDYPSEFEVIVINEGESVDVRDAVSSLRPSHHNLYLTFTPEGVRNLSRKKLGVTLGVKAARYRHVVLTTTAVDIPSPMWLRRMASGFAMSDTTEIVLGWAEIDPAEDNARGCRRRAFDHVAESCRWLAPALAGKPFRGSEYNIAYTKDIFMRNNGFARSLNLCNGDDDIFISEIVRPGNTHVELAEDSFVRLRHGNHPRIAGERMLRRCFTESFIRRRPRVLPSLPGRLQIAGFAAGIAAAVLAWPNATVAAASGLLTILCALTDILFWRPAMKAMKSRRLMLTLPWLAATFPLRRAARGIRSRLSSQKKYTWD